MQFKRWGIAILICVSIIGALGFVKFTQIRAAIAFGESFPEPNETTEAVISSFSQWQPSLTVMGEVRAPRTVNLRNELDGMIASVDFESGAYVEAGTRLIQLDIREETAQLDAIRAEIRLAELDVSRLERLLTVNASSREELDRARAERDIAEARARALEATIEKKSIYAPFSGQAGIHQLEVGEYLPPNSLVTQLVGSVDEVWVDFSLPQQHSDISPGAKVFVTKLDDALVPYEAEILAVNSTISTSSRSLMVRAQLNNDAVLFQPGEFVSISVPVNEARQVIELPVEAIRHDAFGTFVYLLHQDEASDWRAARQPVELLHRDGETAFLAPSLAEGEMIATLGSYKLRPGLLTNIAQTVPAELADQEQEMSP